MLAIPDSAPVSHVSVSLTDLAERGRATLCPPDHIRIAVGMASCGQAAGATVLGNKMKARKDLKKTADIVDVGCIGACFAEPVIDVRTPDGVHSFFGRIDERSYWHMLQLAMGRPSGNKPWALGRERTPGVLRSIDDLEIVDARHFGFAQYLNAQTRRVSGRSGLVDPGSLAEYVAMSGYSALERALLTMTPGDVIDVVEEAGLRGRGGAGFPTGRKWRIAAESGDPVRVVVANADEGDPGAYMNRALLESDPHAVLEGLILAGYAVGASIGYIFVRHEYPLAVRILQGAIDAAQEVGLLGANILGSGYGLDIRIVQSAGAFVCGEETSMLQVMSGKRGEAYARPPYPAERGLGGHPTVINNIETLANVSWLLAHGAERYRSLGTMESAGTKMFCLTGDIVRTGIAEVPFGTDAREVVEVIGASKPENVRAVQLGGPSGGVLPYADVVLAYEGVESSGAMIGSGGLVALGPQRCVVDLATHLIGFAADESCGRCVSCRDGLVRLEEMLLSLMGGEGHDGLIEQIEDLALTIRAGAQCGHGKSAVNPVLSSLRYFREEYEEHAAGRCPALVCKPLITFEIDGARCGPRCDYCVVVCPVDAIKRNEDGYFHVLPDVCTNCWACYEVCMKALVKPVPRRRGTGEVV